MVIIKHINLDFQNKVWNLELDNNSIVNIPYENTFLKYKTDFEELYSIEINTIKASVFNESALTFNNITTINCVDLPIELFNDLKVFFKSIKATVEMFSI
jgi:hypothetical protein